MSEKNTAWLLAQWALWQREGVSLRMSARSPLARFSKVARDLDDVPLASEICDDDALRVDRLMGRLRLLDPVSHIVLTLAFVNNLSPAEIGRRMGVSRYTAVKYYEVAYEKFDSWMNGFSACD